LNAHNPEMYAVAMAAKLGEYSNYDCGRIVARVLNDVKYPPTVADIENVARSGSAHFAQYLKFKIRKIENERSRRADQQRIEGGWNAMPFDPAVGGHGLPWLIALAVVGALGWLTGLFIARLSGVGVTIVSIAILVIVHSIFLHRTDIFKGNQAFFGIPKIFDLTSITILVIIAIFAARFFRESSLGLQLRACADDEVGARAMGVNVYRVRLIAWVLGTLFFATAGIAYAFFLGTISARPFYFNFVFLTVAMLILGGLRSVSGAVIGTLLISIGLETIRWLETGPTIIGIELPEMLGLSGLMLGVVIVAVMAFLPNGIMGNREIEEVFQKRR